MPGKFSLYQDLTIEENLNFFATLFGTTVDEGYDSIKAIYSQIERFKDRKAGALGRYEAEAGALVCIGTPAECTLPRRAHHGCRSCEPQGVMGDAALVEGTGNNYLGFNALS